MQELTFEVRKGKVYKYQLKLGGAVIIHGQSGSVRQNDIFTMDVPVVNYENNSYIIQKITFDAAMTIIMGREGGSHPVRIDTIGAKLRYTSRPKTTKFQTPNGSLSPRSIPGGSDKAALAPGGIDLNTSSGMQWKVSKDGNGVEMNIDPAMIERVRREGIDSLSPVIFRITPVTSIWPLVGLKAPTKAGLVGV